LINELKIYTKKNLVHTSSSDIVLAFEFELGESTALVFDLSMIDGVEVGLGLLELRYVCVL
jgi:hypothetical protein